MDLGLTKIVGVGAGLRLELTAELLNAFDMTNTVTYTWTPDNAGIWERIPTRLTRAPSTSGPVWSGERAFQKLLRPGLYQ